MDSSPEVRPQRANPGGNLDPAQVVGRDDFIANLWHVLEQQSVRLTAERRMGKTSIVKKMRSEAPEDIVAIYRSFEDVRSTADFVRRVFNDLHEQLPASLRARTKFAKLLNDLGLKLSGPVELTVPTGDGWKHLLHRIFEGLDDETRVYFFWDEFPVMVGAISETEGRDVAHELLDALRVNRQTHDNVRMVFTGSVGLHHVLGEIRPTTYSKQPVNDMRLIELGGLDESWAVHLARNLFAGEKLRLADEVAVARAIAEATSGIPFYIQHVVAALVERTGQGSAPSPQVVAEVVATAVEQGTDTWEFRQYRDRITSYYGPRVREALAVLDAVAVAAEPLSLEAVGDRVRVAIADVTNDQLRDVVDLLKQDHYLVAESGWLRFTFPIVGRAWRELRSLS